MLKRSTFAPERIAERQQEMKSRHRPAKKGKQVKNIITVTEDTGFSNSVVSYKAIIEKQGFKQVLYLPFTRKDTGANDSLQVWFKQDEGLLLRIDTYGNQINSADIYFNWKLKGRHSHTFGISGHCVGEKSDIWVGSTDAREGFVRKLTGMRAVGKFITPWVKQWHLWLLHGEDTRPGWGNYDADAIIKERINMLPDYVQDAIRGTQS